MLEIVIKLQCHSSDPDFAFFYQRGYFAETESGDIDDDEFEPYHTCEEDVARILGPMHKKRAAFLLPRGDLDANDPFLAKEESTLIEQAHPYLIRPCSTFRCPLCNFLHSHQTAPTDRLCRHPPCSIPCNRASGKQPTIGQTSPSRSRRRGGRIVTSWSVMRCNKMRFWTPARPLNAPR